MKRRREKKRKREVKWTALIPFACQLESQTAGQPWLSEVVAGG
jgi:hypothetical protein